MPQGGDNLNGKDDTHVEVLSRCKTEEGGPEGGCRRKIKIRKIDKIKMNVRSATAESGGT